MKKEFKTMTADKMAEKVGRKTHKDLIKDITSSEKKTKAVLKDSPIGIELADSLFGFYKEVLTPELMTKAMRFSLKVLSILMVNAVDLSQQASAMILSIPQKVADKGVYIEGISNAKDRPVFIQEYMVEKEYGNKESKKKTKGTKLKVVKTTKKK